jgi:signal transduction histidine kinase
MRRLLDALLPRQIKLEIETDSDRSRIPMSRLRIERIVLNLVTNARDAMAEGGRLVVATRLLDDDRVELSVSDSGPGFSDDALAHLFVEGFTTKGDRGGSGRGLPAVRTIVRGVNGTIEVESVAGMGATVLIRFPEGRADHHLTRSPPITRGRALRAGRPRGRPDPRSRPTGG